MSISKTSEWMKGVFALLAAFVLISSSTLAQSGTSSVNGTVADAQGQVVAGATVKLTSTGQGTTRTATTDGSGAFGFSAVPPGAYSIEVEASGFKRSIVREVQALVDKTTSIPVSMEIGDVTANVEVSAGGIENIVNTQDASLGNNFVAKQISQLPLEGRNVVGLLSLQPGVTPDGAVAGGRQDQANITLDGVDINDQQTGLATPLDPVNDPDKAFTGVLRVTPDSIEEFRVTTLNPDATKGRSAGAQVSLITKSGSNQFRGNLFEYHRNTLTTANDWFNNAAGVARPKLIRNLFGGSLGGPILKDKLFFFYNYEGMREAKDEGVTRQVPLASLGQGIIRFQDQLLDANGDPVPGYVPQTRSLNIADINGLTSNGNAVVNVNPLALAELAAAAARYPSNTSTLGDGFNTGGYRFNAPLPVKQNTHTARFDWSVTSDQKHQVSFRANAQHDLFGRPPRFPDTPGSDRWSHPMGLAATHTWLISNNLTNRFNYGLTRLAYSNQGDSGENAVVFRNVFQPLAFTNTFSRVNPTHNITDDLTWIKGNHTLQFGTNIRIIRNKRTDLASAFDNASLNFGFYDESGAILLTPLENYLNSTFAPPPGTSLIVSGSTMSAAQSSLTAVLGRLSQYTANFVFDIDGNPVNGEPTVREWATEEYDFYVQDSWKLRQSLTLNLGLRYGLSRPVYETQGFQAAPNIPLDVYFQRRVAAAERGENYTEPLIVDKAGPKNGKPDFYEWDTNNFQPRISVAWSPNFKDGTLAKIFGTNRKSVLRGGFAITNDYFGQQLAVTFDNNNTLGYTSAFTTPANTYNITDNPAPLFTGFGMDIRGLPGVEIPGNLVFPLQQPENFARRIEQSIDRGVKSPTNYTWNLTYGRELPGKMYAEVSYVARLGRGLLATRDVMTPNNLREPTSGQTWYEATTILDIQSQAGSGVGSIAPLPFFENLYAPGLLDSIFIGSDPGEGFTNTQVAYLIGSGTTDWTFLSHLLDRFSGQRLYYQSQYGALDSFGTIANSDYHGMAASLRQRLGGLTWDLNYTFSKSMDDTSGLQNALGFGAAFILNPLRQRDNYAASDFDMRHIVNFNTVWELPVGKGKRFLRDSNAFVDALLGGWQLSSIVRYNSGEPIGAGFRFFDNSGWPTNWNIKSSPVQTTRIPTGVFFNGEGGLPTIFADPEEAYSSFRSPHPGETGDRNQIRMPSFFVIDMGLQKQFKMPWSETHKLGFKWEVFNLTNTPIFTGPFSETRIGFAPQNGGAPTGLGEFSATKSAPRVMQFALRYDF
ncbi:MAG: TonB-dependent receptor [Pyrinomonadaceae bacterium]